MELPKGATGERLSGKVAIVSGAGFDGEFLGIGAAISILFAAQGASVGLIDVNEERAGHTQSAIEEFGGTASVHLGDVSDPTACQQAVDAVVERYSKLDVLVNNAAIAQGGSVVDVELPTWHRVVDINLNGVMLLSRAAIPQLRAAGGGSIVNVSSIAGTRGMGTAAYAAAKGGVIGLTSDMAYSHGREGIRVNVIIPGHLHTPMGYQGSPEIREARRRAGMLGTEGDAWDAAFAALFFASDESRWITAAQLPVDAGTTATTAFAMRNYLTDGSV